MPRYKLTIEYDGTGLVGWQRQPTGLSVQEILETAVGRFTGQTALVQGAGRTDAGVHATGQCAHVDLARDFSLHEVQGALNFHCKPAAVTVLSVERVPDQFHARLSAVGRTYLYRILNRRAPPAIDRNHVWHVPQALDVDAMIAGAAHLIGHHDFTSFRATMCQARSPLKTLDHLTITRDGNEIHVVPGARSFLHHQVRNIVGTLKLVGIGQWHPDDVRRALEARNRSAAGPTAPPEGLYLTGVRYPADVLLKQAGSDLIDGNADDDVE